MSLFRSTPYGEERLCRGCVNRGYGEDAWQPATSEFWPMWNGILWFGRCRACESDRNAGTHSVVPPDMRMAA